MNLDCQITVVLDETILYLQLTGTACLCKALQCQWWPGTDVGHHFWRDTRGIAITKSNCPHHPVEPEVTETLQLWVIGKGLAPTHVYSFVYTCSRPLQSEHIPHRSPGHSSCSTWPFPSSKATPLCLDVDEQGQECPSPRRGQLWSLFLSCPGRTDQAQKGWELWGASGLCREGQT